METWAEVAFFLVSVGFITMGIRNVLWSLSKEQQRFQKLISNGLANSILRNAVWLIAFGGLVAFAARTVPHSVSWQVLGAAIVVLGCISAAVARFGSIETPTLEQAPENAILSKRVAHRRLSGVLFIIGGVAWIWNGVPNAA